MAREGLVALLVLAALISLGSCEWFAFQASFDVDCTYSSRNLLSMELWINNTCGRNLGVWCDANNVYTAACGSDQATSTYATNTCSGTTEYRCVEAASVADVVSSIAQIGMPYVATIDNYSPLTASTCDNPNYFYVSSSAPNGYWGCQPIAAGSTYVAPLADEIITYECTDSMCQSGCVIKYRNPINTCTSTADNKVKSTTINVVPPAPVDPPAEAPVNAPEAAPALAPESAPVAEPVEAPVDAPVAAPVAAPTAAPVASTTTAPVAEAPHGASVQLGASVLFVVILAAAAAALL